MCKKGKVILLELNNNSQEAFKVKIVAEVSVLGN